LVFCGFDSLITRIRRWPWLLAAGALTVGVGFWLWIPKLTIDAYPTTYVRSIVPYNALSIAHGLQLYGDHCAICHGTEGYGDGPAAAGLRPRPADLTAKHTADHTAGDIFWWLTHGMKEGDARLPESPQRGDRWDLINVVESWRRPSRHALLDLACRLICGRWRLTSPIRQLLVKRIP
jgi:putative copper resistance protein D